MSSYEPVMRGVKVKFTLKLEFEFLAYDMVKFVPGN